MNIQSITTLSGIGGKFSLNYAPDNWDITNTIMFTTI